MTEGGQKRRKSDRILNGFIRIGLVSFIASIAFIVWHESGSPNDDLNRKISEISDRYMNLMTEGTPVYFLSEGIPKPLTMNVLGLSNNDPIDAEQNLLDDAVQCLKKYNNKTVRISGSGISSLASLAMPSHQILPMAFVLFSDEKSARKAFSTPGTVPDFRDIGDDNLEFCVTSSYRKISDQMAKDIEDAKSQYYQEAFIFSASEWAIRMPTEPPSSNFL